MYSLRHLDIFLITLEGKVLERDKQTDRKQNTLFALIKLVGIVRICLLFQNTLYLTSLTCFRVYIKLSNIKTLKTIL